MEKNSISNRLECLLELQAHRLAQTRQQGLRPIIAVPNELLFSYVTRALSALAPEGGLLGVPIVSLHEALDMVCELPISPLQVITALLQANIPLEKKALVRQMLGDQRGITGGGVRSSSDPWTQRIQAVVHELQQQDAGVRIRETAGLYELFVFGFSALSARDLALLETLSCTIHVSGFFLSPCMMYWSDLLTDRTANLFIEKYVAQQVAPQEAERYRAMLLDRNPLLANCGKLGHEFLQKIEAKNAHTKYALSLPVQRQYEVEALCEQFDVAPLQGGITMLEQLQGSVLLLEAAKRVCCKEDDHSVQVHGAPTRFREVEVLYDALLHMNLNSPLAPGSICIAVEHLEEYLPAIERVFKAPTSCFSYTVIGGHKASCAELVALEAILQLPKKRFAKDSVLQIASLPIVQANFGMDADAWERFLPQFKELPFSFGFDAAHRTHVLEQEGFSLSSRATGTWKETEQMLRSLYTSGQMGSSESTVMSQVVHLINHLFVDVCQKAEKTEPLTVWLEWMYQIVETYVKTADANYFWLIAKLERIKNSISPTTLLSFDQCVQLLREACSDDDSNWMRHVTQEVVVTEWSSLGAPCQVVALLGLQEKPISSIEAQETRYRLIEAVLAARSCLYLSYTNYSYEDSASILPSYQLQELLSLFDRPRDVHQQHPLLSETLSWQQEAPSTKAPSFPEMELASSYYVDLEEVRKKSQKPLMTYFRTALGLDLSSAHICAREKHRYGWFDPEEEIIQSDSTILPQAISLAHDAYTCERRHRDGTPHNSFQVELSVSCTQAYEEHRGYWVLPAIQCRHRLIYGMLKDSTDEGFVVNQAYSKEAVYAFLPDLLVRSVINLRGDCDLPNIIHFTKEGKTIRVSIPHPQESLERCMDILDHLSTKPCPLYPDSILSLSQGKPVQDIYDPYFDYARLEAVEPAWVETAQELVAMVEVSYV